MTKDGTPVDWHVHVHDPAALSATLDTAATHFRRLASRTDLLGILALAELPGQGLFAHLAACKPTIDGWRISPTSEMVSLLVEKHGSRLALVSGFQVVTQERLEVLALATRTRPPSGLPANKTIAEIGSAGGIAVLPWGVGKWLDRRGRLVEELAATLSPRELALGDNAGRPWFWPTPAAFRIAHGRGLAVLPGSDTLPGARPGAGRVGALVTEPDLVTRPAEALRSVAADPDRNLTRYGAMEGTAAFLQSQIGLRVRRTRQ